MTFADTTAASQSESLQFEFDLPHPLEKVWRALSEPDLLAQWLLPAIGFGLAPGTEFTFKADPQPGWDGIVHSKVLEVEVGTRLSYAWVVGDINTVVTFTLKRSATGTRLVLVQSGFKSDQKRNWGGARYGWRMMGEKLVALLDNGA